MLSRIPGTASLPDALTVIGSAGSVVGAVGALLVSSYVQRQALEDLALGAAIGAVSACCATFFAYLLLRAFG
jgi:hypothetical protein